MTAPDSDTESILAGREVIPPAPKRPPRWRRLVPIARFLVEERGHLPLYEPERWGFTAMGSFQFSRRITRADREAINERFVLPRTFGFHEIGLIQDNETGVWFEGSDEIIGLNGLEPIEIWEAQERALSRTYGRPDLGERKAGPPLSE